MLTMAQCSKPEHQPPFHHLHHLLWVTGPWQKSEAHPTHQLSRWGCFTSQGNYPNPETTEHQEKEGRGQPPRPSPGWPLSAPAPSKFCRDAAPLSLEVKNTHTHTPMHAPQNTFSISTPLCLTPSMAGRQLPATSSFQRKAGGFLILPAAATHSLTEGNRVPTDTRLSQRS